MSEQQPKFEWTDELVFEIVGNAHRDGFHKDSLHIYDRIQEFKQSKVEQSKPERIEVSDMYQMYVDRNTSNKSFLRITFNVEAIENDKYPEIKQVLESVLNNDTPDNQSEGLPLPKDFVSFDNIAMVDVGGNKKPLSDLYILKYTQSEVDAIREDINSLIESKPSIGKEQELNTPMSEDKLVMESRAFYAGMDGRYKTFSDYKHKQ